MTTKRLDSEVGKIEYDELVFSCDPTPKKAPVTILSGQGKLKRGTVLAVNADNKMVILGTDNGQADDKKVVFPADCILAEDVDATSADEVAMAYVVLHANKNALILKTSYTMTANDVATLREKGILLSNKIAV